MYILCFQKQGYCVWRLCCLENADHPIGLLLTWIYVLLKQSVYRHMLIFCSLNQYSLVFFEIVFVLPPDKMRGRGNHSFSGYELCYDLWVFQKILLSYAINIFMSLFSCSLSHFIYKFLSTLGSVSRITQSLVCGINSIFLYSWLVILQFHESY